ncbi:MAG: hypothetical protein A2270_08800 [Elusimicrobia bacterium RIFOXYA12_FULL_51_18]|nr:MAG: hypothetical protein A2270_08800 [Elusimicrobia bacterium RIFOXYA12_FULL_51_18]OGS31495.1 MAG: hypothetical protein A2218_09540 [Elusimicrobia bacterium RIFOXYA2_FULL_53_38]
MNKKIYFIVFVTAFILRLGLLLGYKGISQTYEKFDAKAYEAVAVNLMQGNGFIEAPGMPTDGRPPVYPIFLAAVYSITGHSEFAARLLQCFIDSGSAVLLMLIAGMIFTPAVAALSGVLAALYPPFILYSNMKMTECLFIFLFLLECYYLTKAFKERDNKSFVYSGIFHGISVLVRAPTLLFPLFLLPGILFTGLRKSLLKGFVLYVMISSAIVSVWTIRNYYALNDFLAVNTGSGWLLWYAIQDDAWNGDEIVQLSPLREYPELKDLPRSKMESIVGKKVVKYALTHPGSYSWKMAKNFVRLWRLPIGKVMLGRVSPALAGLYQAAHCLLLITAFFGLFYISKSNFICALPTFLYLSYVSLMHSVIIGTPRYRLPYDHFLLMFFAGGLVFLYNRFKKKPFETPPAEDLPHEAHGV